SVIDSLDKPSIASQVAKDSIYRLLFMRSFGTRNRHIPLIASPIVLSPPVTRRPPRTRQPQNFSAYASTPSHLRSDSSWPAVWSFHFCRQRWPEDSETQKGSGDGERGRRGERARGRGAEGKRRRGEGGKRGGALAPSPPRPFSPSPLLLFPSALLPLFPTAPRIFSRSASSAS